MQLTKSFWSHFEEISSGQHLATPKTMTEQREEPDQRSTSLGTNTNTMTKTREEQDQDPGHTGYSAIPKYDVTGTHTETRSREESDQDYANSAIHAVATATKTVTAEREEGDQDESSRGFETFPRVGDTR